MNKQREELHIELEALMDEMRQSLLNLDPNEMVWIHQPLGMPPIISREPVLGAVPYSQARKLIAKSPCTTPSARKPLTDREITSLMIHHDFDSAYRDRISKLIRAVEMTHGIGDA
jgi:hypothetical protein